MHGNGKMNERMAGILNGLTEEQKKKARTCKSKKDLLDFLGAEGVELPDELLDSVAGGATYRYNSEYKCYEMIAKDGVTVIEIDPFCVDEKDAAWWAAYWSEIEDAGML